MDAVVITFLTGFFVASAFLAAFDFLYSIIRRSI